MILSCHFEGSVGKREISKSPVIAKIEIYRYRSK
jgi:hypothetical protein